jgi:hypothetical protein
MDDEFPGYDHYKTSGPPDEPEGDDEDNATIREGLRESVEEEHSGWTEDEVEEEVERRFEEEGV